MIARFGYILEENHARDIVSLCTFKTSTAHEKMDLLFITLLF